MASENIIPKAVTDTLLHFKDENNKDVSVFPITRYNAVLNAPKIVNETHDAPGAPFFMLETDTVQVSRSTLYNLMPKLFE